MSERSGEAGVDDPVQQYLNNIGRIPLLTAAQERSLALAYERGRAATQQLWQGRLMPPAHRRKLQAEVQSGQEARTHLVDANLRLVVSVAKMYQHGGLSLLDLVQEGNIGLMRAVEKFDVHRGFRFSTYATWWVRQAITRAIADQGNVIRRPVHLTETFSQIRRADEELSRTLQREPTREELAVALNMPMPKLCAILDAMRDVASLDSPAGDDERATCGDFIVDTEAADVFDQAVELVLRSDVRSAFDESFLDDREQRILTLRYGLADGRPRTLEDVGRTLGITRERTRQLEHQALDKMRQGPCRERLLEYLSL
jgi:RNA polymerase primary sigma factor